ncbi:Alpha/Beta hydrolase protein [Gigaspora rosea]|uniref:Alpha/Beta hydrolase protein n=1 Tax=Gigaspora rosea TaxID=44941 RepID=A0A397UTK9_9GLOM|nr:Alpha/Beta hydrolase protein [Gigaspora rosea]
MSKQFVGLSVDPSVKVIEGQFKTSDGFILYTRTWKAVSDKPIATVVFIHGFAEYVKRYDHVFDKFARENIEVYAYDQRGCGQTTRLNKNMALGNSGGWIVTRKDITEALRSQRKEGIPQFLVGHSMGGGLTLRYACEGDERLNVAGYISASPWLRLSPQTLNLKRFLALSIIPTASMFLPNLTVDGSVDANYISRDPDQAKKYSEDYFIQEASTHATLRTHINTGGKLVLEKEYKNMVSPIYLAHGSADPITDPNASKEFIQKIKVENVMFREWEGRYHESMHY